MRGYFRSPWYRRAYPRSYPRYQSAFRPRTYNRPRYWKKPYKPYLKSRYSRYSRRKY